MFQWLYKGRRCVYCTYAITFFDRLLGNEYQLNSGAWAHVSCKVEPKAGA